MAPHTSYTPVGGMEYEEPVSRTYQYRKVMKPMLERKRRARINRCLDELKDLMVTALQAEGENVAKLEKADILELTVRHLHTLRAARRLTLTPENSYADRFREGFTQCAQEVSSFLSTPVAAAVHPAAGAQLMRHLGGCLRRLEGPASTNTATTTVTAVSKTTPAVSPAASVMINVPQNVYTPPQSPVSVVSSSGESTESSNAVWRPWWWKYPRAPSFIDKDADHRRFWINNSIWFVPSWWRNSADCGAEAAQRMGGKTTNHLSSIYRKLLRLVYVDRGRFQLIFVILMLLC